MGHLFGGSSPNAKNYVSQVRVFDNSILTPLTISELLQILKKTFLVEFQIPSKQTFSGGVQELGHVSSTAHRSSISCSLISYQRSMNSNRNFLKFPKIFRVRKITFTRSYFNNIVLYPSFDHIRPKKRLAYF